MRTAAEKIAHFWERVSKTEGNGCWEWQGAKHRRTRYGYADHVWQKKKITAHRLSWILSVGPIPQGMMVCHHCDNRPCVRPDHLFLGTAADNAADRDAKGRARGGRLPGENNGFSKLTAAQVQAIRERHALGTVTQRDIALEFGIGQTSVSRIVRGVRWREP